LTSMKRWRSPGGCSSMRARFKLNPGGPFAEGKNNIFENELLLSIAGKYNKSVPQVILRWLMQRDVVTNQSQYVRKE
jgi:hypothetical protein